MLPHFYFYFKLILPLLGALISPLPWLLDWNLNAFIFHYTMSAHISVIKLWESTVLSLLILYSALWMKATRYKVVIFYSIHPGPDLEEVIRATLSGEQAES